MGRGDRLLDELKLTEALLCAESALRRKPIEGAYIVRGIGLRKLGRVNEAIAAYDELERLNPKRYQVHFNRANAYRDLANVDLAIRDYTTALGLAHDPEKAYLNRGNVFLRLKRLDMARDDYRKAAELESGLQQRRRQRKRLVHGQLLGCSGAFRDVAGGRRYHPRSALSAASYTRSTWCCQALGNKRVYLSSEAIPVYTGISMLLQFASSFSYRFRPYRRTG